jgi:hypothetical protein
MKISYDYSILIREIQEELEDGVLSESDFVQIMRAPAVLRTDEDPAPSIRTPCRRTGSAFGFVPLSWWCSFFL